MIKRVSLGIVCPRCRRFLSVSNLNQILKELIYKPGVTAIPSGTRAKCVRLILYRFLQFFYDIFTTLYYARRACV